VAPRGRRALVIAGCLLCQVGLGFTYLFDTYLREITAEFGWSRASFSAAHASRLVALALASPLAGWATERFGPRTVLGGGLGLLAAVGLGYGRIDALWQLWPLSLAIGLVMAALGDVAVASVVTRWVGADRRGLALGLVYSGSNVGGMIAVLASTPIVEAAGWRASPLTLVFGGSLVLLPFVLWAVRLPESTPEPGTAAAPWAFRAFDLGQALRASSFWRLFVALAVFYFYYIAVLDHLVAFLQDVGLSRSAASQAFGASILLGVASKLGIGLVFDRLPARVGLIANFAVLAVASALLAFVPAPGVLPVFVVLHGAAVAAQNVTYPVVVAHCFGVEHVARIYGVLMLALAAGGLPGSVFAGAVFDRTGSYTVAWSAFALANAAALLLLLGVRRETEDDQSLRDPDPASSQ
jgi:MFS family permease